MSLPFNKTPKYDRLFESDEDESPPHEQVLVNHDSNRWNQIENLDDFFTRIYNYHRHNGFWCMFIDELFQLLQFVFVVIFVVFLTCCINYDTLGLSDPDIADAIDFSGIFKMHGFIVLMVIIAMIGWVIKCIKFVYDTMRYREIKDFYKDVLKISEDNLINLDWSEVQLKMIESQRVVQLCLHKDHLTELDISNRILRMENYTVAMINKKVIPYTFMFPGLGNRVFLSKGLMFNLEFILFYGPWAPFKGPDKSKRNSWQLHERYKRRECREALAAKLHQSIMYIAIVNFLMMPFIFMWQMVFLFVNYAELVKREPGLLGVRIWSLYARHFLRHYNELNHEFDSRLKKAYIPANKYLNLFTSPMVVIIAKNCGFFAGAIMSVIVILTLINEELLLADHIPLTLTVLGITVSVCRSLIPNKNTVFCPDVLMKEVLQHTHYQPDQWNNNAHLPHVRAQFSTLFVFKGAYLAEELISPLITPFILFYNVRFRALEFVDFLRNYTVNVVGVGDVCSFSQMDIRRHGNPEWMAFGMTSGTQKEQAEHGKTELSLINFSIRNPAWQPKENEAMYISTIKALAKQDGDQMANSMVSPMLASMGVPSHTPQSAPTDYQPHYNQHDLPPATFNNLPHASSSEHHSINSASTLENSPKNSLNTIELDMEMPPQQMSNIHGSVEGERNSALFDEHYKQIEESYRETRQPISMQQSVRSIEMTQSGLNQFANLQRAGLTNSQLHSMDGMSTLDASSMRSQSQMFMSASPYMEGSQYAAQSSLSQSTGANPMNVSWTQVRSEYRDVARDHDVNSSSLYLHSLHNKLKCRAETPEDMMTRSLLIRGQAQSSEHMSRSYPQPSSSSNERVERPLSETSETSEELPPGARI